MAVNIKLKRSAVPGKVPSTSSLELGEIALNTYEGKAYMLKQQESTQTVIELASTSGSILSASYANFATTAATASYSTTLGASLSSPANNQVRLLASDGSTLSTVTVNNVTSASYALSASFATTASFAENAPNSVSASYAATASSADNFLIRGSATASNLLVTDTITAQRLVVQTITSSQELVTGSTKFGTSLSNTHQFTGSVSITGSLGINGVDYETTSASFDGRINGISGSFITSASFNSFTASTNNSLADIKNATASLYAATASIYNATQSLYNATASIYNATQSLYEATASLYAFTASILNHSSSISASVDALNNFSASILNYTSSNNNNIAALYVATASLYNFSSSILNFTSSTNNAIAQLYAETASLKIATGSLSSSIAILSSSFLIASSSFDTRINSLTESVFTHIVTDSGGQYLIDGVTKPKLSFVPGATYRFNTTAVEGSHPFKFSTSPNGPTQYTTGVTSGSNYIQIEVNYDTPTTLYYYCTIHSGMGNEISVLRIDALVTTSSFNSFTSSYYTDSASFGTRITTNSASISLLSSSFTSFSSSYLVDSSSFDTRINSLTESVFTHIVTNSGASNYIIDGVANPILSFVPGATYKFNTSGVVGSHPFKFSTSPNGPTQYTTGVTSGSNYIQIEVNYDTPTTLYYYCTNHSGMGNAINVLRIDTLATTASFNSFTSSYYTDSSSFNTRITNNSASIATLSSSFLTFSSSYNTGSFTGSFTGSLNGTASWASNALQSVSSSFADTSISASYAFNATSASFAITASHALNVPATSSFAISASHAATASYVNLLIQDVQVSGSFNQSGSLTVNGNITTTGTITAQTLYVQEITSSRDFVTGSTHFGTQITDTHQFTGSVTISGSLAVNGSSVITSNQTSSMSVLSSSYALTASFAENSRSASYALSASNAFSSSYALTASFIENAQTASFVQNAVSASYALSASNAFSSSYALTASFVENAVSASYVLNAISSSFASTASFVQLAQSASYVLNAVSSSHADFAQTSSLSLRSIITASAADSTITFTKGDNSTFSVTIAQSGSVATASYALFAETASFVTLAQTASFVQNAQSASYVLNAVSSSFASTASFVQNAVSAAFAELARSASFATTASFALNAGSGGGGSSTLSILDEGNLLGTASFLDFVGAGVTATVTNGTASINIPGGSGGGQSGGNAILTQSVASVTWSFTHNLGTQYPVFTIYDNNDDVIIPQRINVVSTSSALIYFSSARTGFAVASQGGDIVSASYAISASHASNSTSASFASTASFVTLAQTASFVTTAQTASFVANAQSASNAVNAITASSADNFLVRNTLTAQTIVVQTITSSVDFVTGSTHFGTIISNTHEFTGSVSVSGSLAVNDSNVVLTNQTSSMSVLSASFASTASFVQNAISASFASTASFVANAQTASFVQNAISSSYANNATTADTASFVQLAQSASYVLNAVSASFASTASFVQNAQTASFVQNAVSASFANNSTSASYAENANTSSFALTASYAENAGAGSGFPFSGSAIITGSLLVSQSFVDFTKASYVTGSLTGSLLGTASFATSASYAVSSSFADFALTASTAPGYTVQFTQSVSAATWSFTHNMNTRNPIVQVYDSSYKQIIPNDIIGTSVNDAEIRFDYATTGYVVMSNGGGLYVTGSTSELNQTSAAITWSFTHNLNSKYVNFTVYDSNDFVIIPANIKAIDVNSAELYFATSQTGRAVAQFSGINGAPNATTASYALTATSASFASTSSYINPIVSSYVVLTQVSQSLNYVDDTAASAGGVPLGGLYRNGNFIMIRIV